MTQQHDPFILLRMLKGAPLSCYVALLLVHQQVTARWLSAVTGYGNQAVTTALETLSTMRLAACDSHRSAWRLLEGHQMLLVIPDHENHDLPPTTTAVNNHKLNNKDSSSRSRLDHEYHDPDPLVYEILRKAGIGDPMLTRLSRLDLDPLFVYAHVSKARREFKSTGILITRLLSRDHIETGLAEQIALETYYPQYFEEG